MTENKHIFHIKGAYGINAVKSLSSLFALVKTSVNRQAKDLK